MKNYTLEQTKFIEEIHSEMKIYRHDKTGARICCISNNDTNKVFAIAFRTPPINSTGLTHILEHSVLCGSKKFPVKDPFLEMMKGSLNTFLNAFTFPDKTVYPVASQNDKDFKNLMEVYMDAVLYPNIYQREEIFRQEGWRYEIFDKKDPLVYNGVVYNEMKGAFSNPDDILFRNLMHSLFPDNAYQYESGGEPSVIPELTYKEFKEFHKKYYSPSNSYIYLYGNCDMEERLEWLDKEYLSKFDKVEFDTKIALQPDFNKLNEVKLPYPIGQEESEDHKAMFAYSMALKDRKDALLSVAIQILDAVLVNDPGAPLKKAFLDAGIGDSVDIGSDGGLVQPIVFLIIKNANPEDKDKLLQVYRNTLQSIAQKGLDHKSIASHIDNIEFTLREDMFGSTPKGLNYVLNSLNSWLYDDNDASSEFEVLKLIPILREKLEHGYFEDIIKTVFLSQAHASLVELYPSKTVQAEKDKKLVEKLGAYKASLTDKQIDELIKKSNELRAYQAAPSTPEEINTLPKLKKEDLLDKPKDYACKKIDEGFDSYFEDYVTNGICYGTFAFDISKLPRQYVQYLSLLTNIFSRLPTEKKDLQALNSEVLAKAGMINFNLTITKDLERHDKSLLSASFSSLSKNMPSVIDLLREIIFETKFDDEHLYEVICAVKNDILSSLSYSGNRYATMRSLSHFDELGYKNDLVNGIGFLDFVTDLCNSFKEKKEEIISSLIKTRDFVFCQERFLTNFTGSQEDYKAFILEAKKFKDVLPSNRTKWEFNYVPDHKSEAIKAPYDVVFLGRGGSLTECPYQFSGSLLTLSNAINIDHLWMNIRVKGGAYGAYVNVANSGSFSFTTYRDPNIASSDEVFLSTPEFIEGINFTPEQLLSYKIGALGVFNEVFHVSRQGKEAFNRARLGLRYENLVQQYEGLINATNADLKQFAEPFRRGLKDTSLVALGSGKLIEQNKGMFDIIRDLIKE